MTNRFNILTIDGGGIKGVRTLLLIEHLEKVTGKKMHELFQLISGTSTGGIIAVMLSIGYSASDILELYFTHGQKIFEKKFLRFGLFRAKYSDKYFNEIIRDYMGSKRLADCKTNIIVPTYDIDLMDKFLFKNDEKQDFSLFDVVRATVSAQSYFEPHKINGTRYIDGGNVINNPSMVCYVEWIKKWSDKPLALLSLGTGREEQPVKNNRNAGKLFWAGPTVDILMTEQSQQTDYFVNKILNENYFRIDPSTKYGSKAIDDASHSNLMNLKKDGQISALENAEILQKFINLKN